MILPMARPRTRRYLIEVKDSKGVTIFLNAAYWDEKEKRAAIAQLARLADTPEVNFYAQPALEPGSDRQRSASQRARPKTARHAPR